MNTKTIFYQLYVKHLKYGGFSFITYFYPIISKLLFGVPTFLAEIIPVEPGPGNAG